MNKFVKRYALTFLGIPIGALGGYIYFNFWGCTEQCAIRSSAINMSIYGALMGGLLFNMFQDFVQKRKRPD